MGNIKSGGGYFPLAFYPMGLSETMRVELCVCFRAQAAAVKKHIEAVIVLFPRSVQNCTIKCFSFPSASKTG